MIKQRDRFVFSSELGQRLRQLREDAGLVSSEPKQYDAVPAAVETDLIAASLIPEETVHITLAEVVDLFRQAAISGRLDQLPPALTRTVETPQSCPAH